MPKKEDLKVSAYDRIFTGFASGASNLASYLFGTARAACVGLTASRRSETEWLATLRVYSAEHREWQCYFGSGIDIIAALLELNTSIQKGQARKDKYRDGPGPEWLPAVSAAPPAAGGHDVQERMF